MVYRDLLLYFFSGTGNSYRAAVWLAEAAHNDGITARVIPIDAASPASEVTGPGQLVGLLCPTHAFTAPWAMIRFAMRLPRGQGASAFAVLTRAGMKIGGWFAPGLEGTGAFLLALILALKGYHVVGATGLDMPVNWTVVMPAQDAKSVEGIRDRARPRILSFLHAILAGGRCFRGFLPLALGLALLPVTAAYLLMGRFFLAKLFYASPSCDGCGLCARSCPVNAIRMKGSPPRPYWTFLCESCTRCLNFCPKNAVEASYPFGALAYFAANIPLAAFLLDWLARRVALAAGWKGTLVEMIIQYPFKLLALAAAYLLFSAALRLPLANRLFTLATPTHYYRRYREPATHLGRITGSKREE